MTDTPDQLGEDRGSFLARVRLALGRHDTTAPTEPPAVDESLARLASSNDDLPGMFTQRAEEVGMNVHRVAANTLAQRLAGLLDELGAKRVVCGVASSDVEASLRDQGVEIVDWKALPGFEVQYDVDAGITGVHAALAETGTLICSSDAEHSRGLSLVPPIHVAIVRASDILPDMIDYWARMESLPSEELPSSQVFITGPSKTADIEGLLVTGVHGPGQVHILLVEDA